MRFASRFLALALIASSCSRELAVPEPPDPTRPGTVAGTVVYAEPGLSTLRPAAGATIELVGGGVMTTAAADGRFVLSPIATNIGTILIRFDTDGDGHADRQRSLGLDDIGGGV